MSAPKIRYICQHIPTKSCTQTVLCCPHGVPHAPEGSCGDRDCRFAPDGKAMCAEVRPVTAPVEAAPIVLTEPEKPATGPHQVTKLEYIEHDEDARVHEQPAAVQEEAFGPSAEELKQIEQDAADEVAAQDQPDEEPFFVPEEEAAPKKGTKGKKKVKNA